MAADLPFSPLRDWVAVGRFEHAIQDREMALLGSVEWDALWDLADELRRSILTRMGHYA